MRTVFGLSLVILLPGGGLLAPGDASAAEGPDRVDAPFRVGDRREIPVALPKVLFRSSPYHGITPMGGGRVPTNNDGFFVRRLELVVLEKDAIPGGIRVVLRFDEPYPPADFALGEHQRLWYAYIETTPDRVKIYGKARLVGPELANIGDPLATSRGRLNGIAFPLLLTSIPASSGQQSMIQEGRLVEQSALAYEPVSEQDEASQGYTVKATMLQAVFAKGHRLHGERGKYYNLAGKDLHDEPGGGRVMGCMRREKIQRWGKRWPGTTGRAPSS
jgi:hypothetical protein